MKISADVLIAILGSGGLFAVIASVVTGIFSKRKLGAEATKIITDAATGVVTTLREEAARERASREAAEAKLEQAISEHRSEVRAMAAAFVQEREEFRRVSQLHVAWDALAIAKMSELGVDLPPAPPMMPPLRHIDDDGYPIKVD